VQRTVLLFICFLICVNCFSQQYPFVHYTPREGLVNNRCRFIYQDSKGKLYIATYGGLSVYDGSRFTNYSTSNGLADNLVNDVVEMGEDSVWIIPNVQKIHCLVKGQLKDFIPSDGFSPSINQLVKTSTGNYYAMAEDGLFRLQNKRFIKVSPDTAFGNVAIKTLLQGFEFDNKLFILFNPGYKLPATNLLVYDLATNQLIACNKNEPVGDLIKGYGKELWIRTAKGLCIPDKIDEKTRTVKLKALSYNWPIPKNVSIYSAFVDRQNNVWLQTSKGLYRIKNNVANLFTTENGLITNYQTFIFQDAENNMWFVNDQTGVSKLSNQQLAFYPSSMPGYSASDIFIGSASDSVWMHDIYHRKLIVLLPGGERKEYEDPDESLPGLARFVSANKKWFTCGKFIYQVKLQPDNKHYSSRVYFGDSNNTMGFSCSAIDRNGNLVTVSDKLVVITNNKILTAPVFSLVDQLAIDKANRIWVVNRSNQLYCFQISDNDNSQLVLLRPYFSIVKGSPRSITADQSGNIWIGTRDQGLYCLHFNGLELQSSKQVTMQNGLSENFISYLYCDKDNTIWACTPSGLDRIKVANNNFLVENITRSSNLYYPISKIQQTSKGLFWIMSGQGLIRYDPVKPSTGSWKPQLLFSEVLVNNNQTAITNNDKLKYFQNNLVFQLSAPTYIDEKQTRFSYLLEGSGNNEWSHLSPNPSINLVNLPPGNYTLRARAIFLHGLYPNAESSYSFIILPPWWQTAWFKLLMAIVLAGLIFFSVRFYFKRKLQLQMIALEKKQAVEKERTRIATDMHDDLGAGLSKIKFLSETIGMKKQQHLPIEEEITRIRTYSHEMIDKMGEIVWALNEKNDSLEDLLSYTRSYAVEYLQENGIHCKVNEPDVIPDINVSGDFRRNIYLTVKETLHNIVKHAQATEVEINIEIRDRLVIQIQDNGIGIDTTPIHSPGNGLFNMNKRIEGLNGRFKIVNNNGTQININVPLTN
jgi:signal transduction histidine kinase